MEGDFTMKRGLFLLLLALGLWSGVTATAQADDPMRLYHYPYTYYPFDYQPLYYHWPDSRQSFQPAPPYMYYPPYRVPSWRYEFWEYQRYYRGNHFFLDQF
jgi:hypothetical protein